MARPSTATYRKLSPISVSSWIDSDWTAGDLDPLRPDDGLTSDWDVRDFWFPAPGVLLISTASMRSTASHGTSAFVRGGVEHAITGAETARAPPVGSRPRQAAREHTGIGSYQWLPGELRGRLAFPTSAGQAWRGRGGGRPRELGRGRRRTPVCERPPDGATMRSFHLRRGAPGGFALTLTTSRPVVCHGGGRSAGSSNLPGQRPRRTNARPSISRCRQPDRAPPGRCESQSIARATGGA